MRPSSRTTGMFTVSSMLGWRKTLRIPSSSFSNSAASSKRCAADSQGLTSGSTGTTVSKIMTQSSSSDGRGKRGHHLYTVTKRYRVASGGKRTKSTTFSFPIRLLGCKGLKMTPDEREMLTDLARKVAQTPPPPKDAEAEDFIRSQIGRRPDALYVMTQTVLIQNMALQQAQEQIQDLQRQLQQ